MLHEGQESSSRKLVWVEGRCVRGCSECAWAFNPSAKPAGKSLDEMKRNFQMQLSKGFASHDCSDYPLIKEATLSSLSSLGSE